MLFLGFTADRKVQVMEASPGACNGRVCRNIYPLASLLARGYVPRRFRALANDATAPVARVETPLGKSGRRDTRSAEDPQGPPLTSRRPGTGSKNSNLLHSRVFFA